VTRSVAFLLAVVAVVAPAGAAVHVGSKIDVESAILDNVAARLINAAGVPAVAEPPLGGTDAVFRALVHGDVDLYPDYTGTISHQILHDPSLVADDQLRAALATRGIGMTGAIGFDDTYAVGMTEPRAAALGIRTIGDLARHPELRLGFSTEFAHRPDGWPGVAAAYGVPAMAVQTLDHQLAYRGLLDRSVDVTDLYSTDAEIAQYHLRVLADDRHFFPAYQAVFLYRLDLIRRAPGALAAIDRLVGRIDAAQMQALNARAKVDRLSPAAVAAEFVGRTFPAPTTAAATAPEAAAGPSTAIELWHLTLQHLLLVGVSLSAAILVALPLGVAAGEFPRFGHAVLVVVAGIYTIPSLALLVFMIPLLGIGFWPAVVALFLYSLLPIVRNTQAGLRAVPPQLRESAEVLGLSRWARLLRVEVPMASPSILAGIKTSAVLNVGTATLGGLIGAGGYGQPILDGIILDSTRLVLLGAIPAAAMALLIQAGFDLLEPLLVPRGLRLRPAAE
jgi:osmoprotectant transport system permease protein